MEDRASSKYNQHDKVRKGREVFTAVEGVAWRITPKFLILDFG